MCMADTRVTCDDILASMIFLGILSPRNGFFSLGFFWEVSWWGEPEAREWGI